MTTPSNKHLTPARARDAVDFRSIPEDMARHHPERRACSPTRAQRRSAHPRAADPRQPAPRPALMISADASKVAVNPGNYVADKHLHVHAETHYDGDGWPWQIDTGHLRPPAPAVASSGRAGRRRQQHPVDESRAMRGPVRAPPRRSAGRATRRGCCLGPAKTGGVPSAAPCSSPQLAGLSLPRPPTSRAHIARGARGDNGLLPRSRAQLDPLFALSSTRVERAADGLPRPMADAPSRKRAAFIAAPYLGRHSPAVG